MIKNPVELLWYANPKVLEDIVGFKIETFYQRTNEINKKNEYVMWEKGIGDDELEIYDAFLNGKTKVLNADKLEKKCYTEILKIQRG